MLYFIEDLHDVNILLISVFTESETIHLKEKDHIRWQLRDLRLSSKGSSTSLRFRFKAASKDGVIFYTKRYGNILLVELNDGVLRVAAGKATESMFLSFEYRFFKPLT